jgi:aminoglycoside phosphotransferase (APT) family kinase protein
MRDVFSVIAENRRDAVRLAIESVADPASVSRISQMTGGASGATTLKVEVGAHAFLLRLDPGRRGFQNPARSYPCLRAAAAAGIAPAVHHADEVAGIVLMDFVSERPATAFPGGQPALVRSLGDLVARLQATAPFPVVMEDFGALVDAMLNLVVDGGLFAAGVLDRHVAGLERIRAEYPSGVAPVSAHNDINPRNVLFDGERLWLVDWELAFGNDPFADLANIANNFSEVSDVDNLVLEGWLGRAPDDDTRLRLALMRDLHRLFYAGLMLSEFVGQREPEAELIAPTQDEFRAALARGELRGTPELLFVLGKMHLVSFTASRRP